MYEIKLEQNFEGKRVKKTNITFASLKTAIVFLGKTLTSFMD